MSVLHLLLSSAVADEETDDVSEPLDVLTRDDGGRGWGKKTKHRRIKKICMWRKKTETKKWNRVKESSLHTRTNQLIKIKKKNLLCNKP